MDFSNLKVMKALKANNGIIDQADTVAAGVIMAVGKTTKELDTEIKCAAAGAFLSLGSDVISGALGAVGLDVNPDTINAVGGALVLGAAASATNKVINNYCSEVTEDNKVEKPKVEDKKVQKAVNEEVTTEEVKQLLREYAQLIRLQQAGAQTEQVKAQAVAQVIEKEEEPVEEVEQELEEIPIVTEEAK